MPTNRLIERLRPLQDHRPTSRWKKHVRFSVRGLIVLILAIGGGTGWWLREVRVQRDAVDNHPKSQWMGGVRLGMEWRETDPQWKASGPAWLVDRLGVDWFTSVTVVDLGRIWRWGIFRDRRNMSVILPHVGRLRRVDTRWRGRSDDGA